MSRTTKKKTRSKKQYVGFIEPFVQNHKAYNIALTTVANSFAKQLDKELMKKSIKIVKG